MSRWLRHHVVEAMPGHIVGWVIGGAIVALSGVSPDDWVAHLVHSTTAFLPKDWSLGTSALVVRSSFAAVGVAVLATTLLWGRRPKERPAPTRDGATSTAHPLAAPPPFALPDKPSIAVLPFQNLSGDPEQDYFCDGMVEDITTGLSRMKWLFVIARNSSFAYKGKSIDARQIGRELGVRYILEGSVRKANNRVRITGQLIDAASGAHAWADRFEGDLADVFELQDKIASNVLGAVEPALRLAEIHRARAKPTGSLDAYDYFLRAFYHRALMTPESITQALDYCERALAIDPNYASASGLAALTLTTRFVQGWSSDINKERRQALSYARTAAEFGSDDPTALYHAGQTQLLLAHDWDIALALAQKALSLNPNSADGWSLSGWANFNLGNGAVAIEQFEQSLRLSPYDRPFIRRSGVGWGHFLEARYDEAVRWADMALQEQPRWATALRCKVSALGQLGRRDEAARAARALLELQPGTTIPQFRALMPLKRPDDMARYLDGLRKAGVPEN